MSRLKISILTQKHLSWGETLHQCTSGRCQSCAGCWWSVGRCGSIGSFKQKHSEPTINRPVFFAAAYIPSFLPVIVCFCFCQTHCFISSFVSCLLTNFLVVFVFLFVCRLDCTVYCCTVGTVVPCILGLAMYWKRPHTRKSLMCGHRPSSGKKFLHGECTKNKQKDVIKILN